MKPRAVNRPGLRLTWESSIALDVDIALNLVPLELACPHPEPVDRAERTPDIDLNPSPALPLAVELEVPLEVGPHRLELATEIAEQAYERLA